MASEQQIIYECSRKTADKQISNSEWINIFRDGIKLNRGDTVRLLGSFISEDGDSSDIQILDNQSFTIEHIPYINVDTVRFEDSTAGAKTHPAQYQLRFGDIASPALSTDSYGIEPPYHILNGSPREQTNNHEFAIQLREPVGTGFMDWYSSVGWYEMYEKAYSVDSSATSGVEYSQGYDYAVNDKAVKIGCYVDTNSGDPKTPITISNPDSSYLVPNPTDKTLSDFTLLNLEHQYSVAHMCKLIYFPVFQGLYVDNVSGTPSSKIITHNFKDDDLLKVGDYISTYFIAQAADHSNAGYSYDTGTNFGDIQWNSGPRSICGKILATNKRFVQVPDPITQLTVSMELQGVYVYEFVNPGSYKNQNDLTNRPRHGSSQQKNGYNTNRNDNRNAGVSYQAYPLNTNSVVSPGPTTNILYPFYNSYLPKNYEVQRVGQEVYGQTDCPLNVTQNINESMNLETNTSLSFFWSCRATDMRPLAPDSPSEQDGIQTHATSWIYPNTVLGAAIPITFLSDFAIGVTQVDIYNTVNKIRPESELVFPTHPNVKIKEIYQFPGYLRLELYAGIPVAVLKNSALTYLPNTGGIYWYPREYKVVIADFRRVHRTWKYEKTLLTEYNNWGAITKMNPENDNVQSYIPETGFSHRLYIPFTQQIAGSEYKARNFGAGDSFAISQNTLGVGLGKNTVVPNGAANYASQPNGDPNVIGADRLRQNFGISCGRGGPGNSINTLTTSIPVPYKLTGVPHDTAYGWEYEFSGTGSLFLNQDSGNSYNDSVCSIHFQRPLDGSQEFKQTVTTGTEQERVDSINAKLWKEDLLYVKKYKTEFKPKPGYYNYQQVAEDINIQLHYNFQDYKKNVGNNTTVGLKQRAKGVSPNVINGNFVHTYLPEVSFGFMPLTQKLYEQDIENWNLNGITNYRTTFLDSYLGSSTPTNDVANIAANPGDINLYFIPFNRTSDNVAIPEDKSLQLFKLNGAKLIPTTNTLSMDHQDPQAMLTNNSVDILNTMTYIGGDTGEMRPAIAGVNYQTRTAFNNFQYGGCAKIFVGAVNPSFEIDEDISRMIFKFLYTPYRPATDDTGTALSLVSGQAVPSAIIDSYGNGGITDSLSGIYIRNLRAAQITEEYSPLDFLGFKTSEDYPIFNSNYVKESTVLWNTLGFNENQLTSFSDNSATLPFTFWNRKFILNNILYNIAETDISVNASNPFYSYCSLWLPPLQFSVEVDSNEIIGARQPLTQNSPFYLIGSDFPGKHYYGNKGTKLPVMGVCSRQFTSFGFAFDLSESAIQWTIETDCLITSIHTKIFNNDMSIPLNLDNNSSIIYAITKSQYYKEPTQQDLKNTEQLMIKETIPPIVYTPQDFMYQNQLTFDAPFYGDDEEYDED